MEAILQNILVNTYNPDKLLRSQAEDALKNFIFAEGSPLLLICGFLRYCWIILRCLYQLETSLLFDWLRSQWLVLLSLWWWYKCYSLSINDMSIIPPLSFGYMYNSLYMIQERESNAYIISEVRIILVSYFSLNRWWFSTFLYSFLFLGAIFALLSLIGDRSITPSFFMI